MENSKAIKSHYDVVIVGARCAGSSTAFLLARAGVKVLLIDRHQYGSDMVSTHALMKVAVLQLKRWGLLAEVMAAGTPEIRKTTFHYGKETIPIQIKPEQGVEYLCAPRRKILDRILVDAARKAGADVFHGISLVDLRRDTKGRVIGVHLKGKEGNRKQVSCDLVVGADGRQSTVARKVEATPYVEGRSSSGYVYGYFDGIPDTGFHWHFNDKVAAGLIPTNSNQHCVFVGVPQAKFVDTFRKNIFGGFLETAAANSPDLHQIIRDAQLFGRLQGFVGLPGYLKQSYGPGWCLVGDACYFKDPLTAHGIADALRDAELLANAILAANSHAFMNYQEIRNDLSMNLFKVTEEIASFDWDTDLVKKHHSQLSNAMKLEMECTTHNQKYTSVAA